MEWQRSSGSLRSPKVKIVNQDAFIWLYETPGIFDAVIIDFPGSDRVGAELNRRKFFCDHRPGAGIRVSPHFYTTDEECERFMDQVAVLRREISA